MTRHKSRGFGYSIEGGANRAFTQKAWEAGRDKRYEQAKKAEYGIEIKPDKWDFGREADTLQTVKNDNVAALEEKKAS